MKSGYFQSYSSFHPEGPRWQVVVPTGPHKGKTYSEADIQDQVRGTVYLLNSIYNSLYVYLYIYMSIYLFIYIYL